LKKRAGLSAFWSYRFSFAPVHAVQILKNQTRLLYDSAIVLLNRNTPRLQENAEWIYARKSLYHHQQYFHYSRPVFRKQIQDEAAPGNSCHPDCVKSPGARIPVPRIHKIKVRKDSWVP